MAPKISRVRLILGWRDLETLMPSRSLRSREAGSMNHSLTKVQYLQTLIDKLLKSASLDKWRLCSESYWFLRIFVPSSYELRKKILSILCIPIFLFHFQTVNILGFKSLDICDKSTNNPHFMTLGVLCWNLHNTYF